ncbi:MAG: SCO family protein [Halieaceae bacterium]|jgi:protein SCO1/2|nr:SCO family protein [Halieaceae bacterium]
MAIVVASFVHRVGEPRVMSLAESRINGLFLFDTPRDVGNFSLIDHAGAPFTADRLEGHWTLLFFGFTHCPDICPTTLSDLAELKQQLQGTEADETVVVMLSVDPARDTPERLSQYVPYFHPDFLGVTGAFESILSVTQRLNAPFRKVIASDGSYQMEHSANVALMNPRGDYHGFFRAPLDIPKMRVTLRSAQYLWDH